MDHPSISVSAYVKPHARINEFTRRHIQVGLRYSSKLPGMHEGDMFVVAVTKSAWHAVGERIASFLIAVYHTCSERGQVKLTSPRLARGAAGRIQSSLRPARSGAADAGLPHDGQALRDAGHAGRELRSVPRELLRARAQGRRRQYQEQAPDSRPSARCSTALRRSEATSSARSSPRASRSSS